MAPLGIHLKGALNPFGALTGKGYVPPEVSRELGGCWPFGENGLREFPQSFPMGFPAKKFSWFKFLP